MALHGLTFNIDLDPKEKKKVSELINHHGGIVSYLSGSQVTHFVTTRDLIEKNGFKIQSAKKHGLQIVTEDFIHNKISNYVPPVRTSYDDTEDEPVGTLIVYKPSNDIYSLPVITSLFPKEGKIGTLIKVSIVGDNFKPTSDMRIKFGSYVCQEIEFHCSSVIIATVRAQSVYPGEVEVSVSNNGRDFGNSSTFSFLDGDEDEVQPWHRKELQSLRNKIFQLQTDLLEVQRMEYNLSLQFEEAITYPVSRPQLPRAQVPVRTQPGVLRIEPKEILNKKDNLKKKPQIIQPSTDDGSREARIFISSPFKDMNEERDLIVKHIIPKLRRLCLERDIVLTCVDLRWGVTEAQTQGAATLLMCLREIEKSNIFIGLYGERYGWCLSENSYRKPTSQDELLMRTFSLASKEFPWVNQYKDRSVTEIEMRMLLDSHAKEKQKIGFFYLRDPYYIENISADKRQDFLSEGEYEKSKLELLKKDINNCSCPSSTYHRPSHLEEILIEDISGVINHKYPQGTELTPFKRERFLHSTYGRSLTRVYLPNEKYFMNLDRFASSNTLTPLVVYGTVGIGKSAVLANWSKRYKEHHPEVVVIEHWIGCSPKSSNYSNILRRIMDELQDYLSDSTDDIPSDTKEMEKLFPSWLEKTLSRNKVSRVVVMVDGLDNLEDTGNSHTLLWLPQQFPATVRIILSMAPSRPLDMARKRNYEMMEIVPIDEGERASFIRQYLNISSKKLTETQEHRIARCSQTGNPRYLKVLLEDISIWGQFNELDKRIEHDLNAVDTSQLYEIVLERLEKDYDKDNRGLVKNFMSYIWASRRGLFLDSELGLLLEQDRIDYNSWQAFYLGVEDLLLSAGGLINFANSDILKAIKQRYITSDLQSIHYHSRLADYFEKHVEGVRDRKVEELAFQLFGAEDWDKLQICVTNLSMFYKLFSGYKFDLFRYWRSLETRYDIVDSYTRALERGDTLPPDVLQGDLYYQVGRFLENMAKYDGASQVMTKARNVYNVASQNLAVAKVDYFLARIMFLQAKYSEAEEQLKKCLALYIRESGEEDLAVSSTYTKLGEIYLEINEFQKAEESFQTALRIKKSKLGTNHWKITKTLTLMVKFYERMSKFEQGLDCGNQALRITEDEFGPDDMNLTPILVAIGRIYMHQDKFKESKDLFKRALRIAEDKVGRDHPKTAEIVYELGCFFFVKPEELGARVNTNAIERFKQRDFWAQRDYSKVEIVTKKNQEVSENKKGWSLDRAEKLFLRAKTIIENTVGTEHPDYARVLNRLGSLYIERVQFLNAEDYLVKALDIRIKKLGKIHTRVAQTYKHLFTLYNLQEKLEQSRDCGLQALEVIQQIYGEKSVEVSNIYIRLGDQCTNANLRDEAKDYFLKAKTIRMEKLGPDHKETLAVDVLIQALSAPPPPPPPPPVSVNVEDLLQNAATEITAEMKAQRGRGELMEAIKNFGKMKEQLASAENASRFQKRAANLTEKKGWWRQNYRAGFDAEVVNRNRAVQKPGLVEQNRPRTRVPVRGPPVPPPSRGPPIPPPPPPPLY